MMRGLFKKIITELVDKGDLSETAHEASCPEDPVQMIPRLIDLGVSPARLTKVLGDMFDWPVYNAVQHGKFEHADKGGQWGYVGGVLFLSCPFDASMQPAALLPGKACAGFRGIGLLPVGDAEDAHAGVVEAERVIRSWLNCAVEKRATDLHVMPLSPNYLRVRVRIDGQLQTLDEMPMKRGEVSYRFISNMLLRMAGCQVGGFTQPLDGRFECALDNGSVEVRMAMRPVSVQNRPCQAFFLRLQGCGEEVTCKTLSGLGLPQWAMDMFAGLRRRNQGLVLMSGPTGSGKSSTLYANLTRIVRDEPWRSVQTLEDPVEQSIEGIVQTQINTRAGMSFGDGLRALMRSDVDVMLVGEVRDEDTARLVVRASLTGQLVFGTVHAKSALLAVERMLDLGVSAQALASVLIAVISQRLLRRVCPGCAHTIRFDEHPRHEFYAGLLEDDRKIKTARVGGCPKCEYGYKGRVVALEAVRIDRRLAAEITDGAPVSRLKRFADERECPDFWKSAAELVARGATTIEECECHLPPYEKPVTASVHSFTGGYKNEQTTSKNPSLSKVAESEDRGLFDT